MTPLVIVVVGVASVTTTTATENTDTYIVCSDDLKVTIDL